MDVNELCARNKEFVAVCEPARKELASYIYNNVTKLDSQDRALLIDVQQKISDMSRLFVALLAEFATIEPKLAENSYHIMKP